METYIISRFRVSQRIATATVLLTFLNLITPQPTQSLCVNVALCIDSDAYDKNQIQAYDDFLSWCEENGVKVAVFYSPERDLERSLLGSNEDLMRDKETPREIH